MTEAEKRYFAETARVLRREGFQVEQLENGHLNVVLDGRAFSLYLHLHLAIP